METSVSLNLSQLLFFVVTGLVGIVWKNLNDKFKAIKDDCDSKIAAVEKAATERLTSQRETIDERSRDRHKRLEDRMQHNDNLLQSINATMAALTAEIKEVRLSMATKFLTKEEFNEAQRRESGRLDAIEERLMSVSIQKRRA